MEIRNCNKMDFKDVYLVAPGYKGEKPEFGTYYSTTNVQGYDTLSVIEVTVDECANEHKLKDMSIAGYDSYTDYLEGIRFIKLCIECAYNKIDYSVLVDDKRLQRLLQSHIGQIL